MTYLQESITSLTRSKTMTKKLDYLDDMTKHRICVIGSPEHRKQLLDHHVVDHTTKWLIASSGDHASISKLLAEHDLDHMTKWTIANKGNDDHRTELLTKKHKLNSMTKHAIVMRGNDQHVKLISKSPTDSMVKEAIKFRQKNKGALTSEAVSVKIIR